jgi:hypothetical protein
MGRSRRADSENSVGNYHVLGFQGPTTSQENAIQKYLLKFAAYVF